MISYLNGSLGSRYFPYVTLYGGYFTFSTQLLTLNYLPSLLIDNVMIDGFLEAEAKKVFDTVDRRKFCFRN